MAGIAQKSLNLIFIVVPQGMGGALKEKEEYLLTIFNVYLKSPKLCFLFISLKKYFFTLCLKVLTLLQLLMFSGSLFHTEGPI